MNEHIDNSAQEAAPADGDLAAAAETETAAASVRSRTTRRRLIKGAAVTAAAVTAAAGALYVKPDLRSFGLPVALAASAAPLFECQSDSDCPPGSTCKFASNGGGSVCFCDGGFCF